MCLVLIQPMLADTHIESVGSNHASQRRFTISAIVTKTCGVIIVVVIPMCMES